MLRTGVQNRDEIQGRREYQQGQCDRCDRPLTVPAGAAIIHGSARPFPVPGCGMHQPVDCSPAAMPLTVICTSRSSCCEPGSSADIERNAPSNRTWISDSEST
jgi:hypothetical protein